MCSKKKDLEIICNLQWKDKPRNGGIIGVYDVPSTTLSWEIFKSYLLKNSGTPGDDVKVSYLATNDKEFPIQSQVDFQIALYAFRKKARNGEIINLKLDRTSDQDKSCKKSPSSIDVQTQFDTDGGGSGSNSSLASSETAPQWFTGFMAQFKKDILNEVSATVSSYVSTIKSHGVHSYHSRKSKTESSKRSRKHPLILCEVGTEKEFLKSLKLEKKVETKFEKLENKSKKLKEKKMSLLTKSSDSDAGHSSSKSNSDTFLSVDITQMNASPVRYQQSVIPHMIGGEVYLHTWEVINNGLLPWTSDTELHFTWGSALLEPVQRVVPCPPLKPTESGSINVLLNVPKICGQYESYWYFHHKGRKFGHWLGCQIIVDNINSAEPLSNDFLNRYDLLKSKHNQTSNAGKESDNSDINVKPKIEKETNVLELADNIEEKVKDLQLAEASSSSENDQNKVESVTAPEEFIFVARAPPCEVPKEVCPSQSEIEPVVLNASPSKIQIVEKIEPVVIKASPSKIQIVEKFLNDMDLKNNCSEFEVTNNDFKEPNQIKQVDLSLESDDNNNNTEGAQESSSESISKIDEDTTSNSTLNDMVMVNFADEMEDHDSGYAYVLVDGTKIPIPKKYLRPDFLETAEDAPDPSTLPKPANKLIGETSSENNQHEVNQIQTETERVTTNIDPFEMVSQPPSNTINGSTKEIDSQPSQANEVSYSFLSQETQKLNESVKYMPSVSVMSNNALAMETSLSDEKGNSRVFVFPQNCPGYEVIPNEPNIAEAKQSCEEPSSETRYSLLNEDGSNQFMKCNIYKKEPSDTNLQYQCFQYPPCTHSEFKNTQLQENSSQVDSFAAFQVTPNQPLENKPQNFSGGSNVFNFVPNYQQTPPELRPQLKKVEEPKPEPQMPYATSTSSNYSFTCSSGNTYTASSITDENVPQRNIPTASTPAPMASMVSGAMTMASSALNTAKNVVNMIIPPRNENEPGVWMNGHWVVTNPQSPREANLQALAEMGFWDRDLNATLLARYNDDIAQVVAELIQ